MQKTVVAPWSGTIEIDHSQSWSLSVAGEGFWAAPVELKPRSEIEEAILELLPAGTLVGAFRRPEGGSEIPSALRVEIESVDGTKPEIPRVSTQCDIESLEWICVVPSGVLDLRLAVDGFVPNYFWDLKIEPSEIKKVGVYELRQGPSLAGWVEYSQRPPGEAAQVELMPQVTGVQEDPVEQRRMQRRGLTGAVNRRGFFQLGPLEVGGYELVVSHEGFANSKIRQLELTEAREYLLEEPIFLEPPGMLEVYLDPPVSPDGQPWRVVLMEPAPTSNVARMLDRSTASFGGYWCKENLPFGDYLLEIRNHRGATWFISSVNLHRDQEPISIELSAVEIQGIVKMGDEPVQGKVIFGTRVRRPNVTLQSDDKGRFRGVLPRGGEWAIEVEMPNRITVLGENVSVVPTAKKSGAEVEIVLPGTAIEGVVTQDGEPVEGAFVLLARRREGGTIKLASMQTESDGRFEIQGVPPGWAEIVAYLGVFDPASAWQEVELEEDVESPEVELALKAKDEIVGRVLSPQGAVPGAQILLRLPTATERAWVSEAISNSDGRFKLKLPRKHDQEYVVLAFASGFGVSLERRTFGQSGEAYVNLSTEKGDLTILTPPGYLHSQGVFIHLDQIIPSMASAGRLEPSKTGFTLSGMASGEYHMCQSTTLDAGCVSGYLAPGGVLELRPTVSWF